MRSEADAPGCREYILADQKCRSPVLHFEAIDRKLDSLEDLFEDLAEEIEPHLPQFYEYLDSLFEREKPLSFLALHSLFSRIESLRCGIFCLAREIEFYSLLVVYRSIIEHFVKFQYLWIRTIKADDDDAGIDYWIIRAKKEKIDYVKSLHRSFDMAGSTSSISIENMILNMKLVSEKMPKSEINKRAGSFRFNAMTSYIYGHLQSNPDSRLTMIEKLFPRYAELSSYVHGGPSSISTHNIAEEEVDGIINLSSFASLQAR